MDALLRMLVGVGSALGISAAIFIGLNLLVDRAQKSWAVNGPLLGFGAGAAVGSVLGLLPAFFIVGGEGRNESGSYPLTNVMIGAVVVGLIGAVLITMLGRDEASRNRVTGLVRTGVFFGPAVLFLAFALIVPALRTGYISLFSRDGDFGISQYTDILTDDEFFGLDGISDVPTSRLTIFAVWAVALGLFAGLMSSRISGGGEMGRQAERLYKTSGRVVVGILLLMLLGFVEAVIRDPNESFIYDVLTAVVSSPITLVVGLIALIGAVVMTVTARTSDGGSFAADLYAPVSSGLLATGFIGFLLAIFSTMRGVIWNNLWWVAAVTGLSTVLGLLLAILADRSRHESIAKAFIFMPMAISMVGAAVIWDFVYTRTLVGNQVGLFNSILVMLGYEPRGFFINASLIPWNNFFIMMIMIWIQTGFAMVILSAAIKGVPSEFVEAARVDGATEIQVFWRVTLPTIIPTVFVVVTTLIITVMKVFDLVKATTNGANGTDVLANSMFNDLRVGNFERSAAFAILIFVLVLPVMVYNIRRTAAEVA